MYFAYILKSQKDGRFYYGSTQNLDNRLKEHNKFYYGSTQNLDNRLKEHNNGRVRASKGHRPYNIHYFESFETRSQAMKRERFFKSISGYNWLKEHGIL